MSAILGTLNGPSIIYMLPASVHRIVMNAFQSTINLITSHLGSNRNIKRSVNEGLIKMVKFSKKLSLRALKRSRKMCVILMPAHVTHHRTERENEGLLGKKLQLHKHGNNFKVNDDSYELLLSRPTSTFRYFTHLHIFTGVLISS